MMAFHRLAIVLSGAALLVAGCYRPSIASGGFQCAAGKVCPDGFHCLTSNNRCYQGDAGPEAATCASPAPMENCSRGPDGGVCNPSCQTGCECGFCSIVSGTASCMTVAAGNNDIGELCDPTRKADCKEGLFCRTECQTTTVGRCYKFCDVDHDCQICGDAGCRNGTCGVTGISTDSSGGTSVSFRLCNLPDEGCDPVAPSGCPAGQDVLACYAEGIQTLCDCRGTASKGAQCTNPSSCLPGLICINLAGKATCQQICRNGGGECTPPASCMLTNGSYGYCQ